MVHGPSKLHLKGLQSVALLELSLGFCVQFGFITSSAAAEEQTGEAYCLEQIQKDYTVCFILQPETELQLSKAIGVNKFGRIQLC